MAQPHNRYASHASQPQSRTGGPSAHVSTQTLLNSLHNAYSTAKPYVLDASTSLVVNTWITAATDSAEGGRGGVVDAELARRAWEHARRRAEDSCIVLGSLHESTPSLIAPFISTLPLNIPEIFYTALGAIQPFVTCQTPQNPQKPRYSSLATTFTLTLTGNLTGIALKLSTAGLDTGNGLLNVRAEPGYRAFDVFYYLLSSATAAEREFLGLKHPSSYTLLKRSETYSPPSYLPTADDDASADAFRAALKEIGVSGAARRDLLSVLAAVLKLGDALGFLVDEETLDSVCEDAAVLLGLEPDVLIKKCSSSDRDVVIAGIYEAVVDWVIAKANGAIAAELSHPRGLDRSSDSGSRAGALTPMTLDSDDDTVSITVLDMPDTALGKAVALKNIFDDSEGINAEMKEDGVAVNPAGHSVINEMNAAVKACEPELGIKDGPAGREKDLELDRRERVLDRIGQEVEYEAFLKKILYPINGDGIGLGHAGRFDIATITGSSRVWFHLCVHPTDELPERLSFNAAAWSAGSPSRQLRDWRLPEWANRRNRNLDFTADFDMDEFCTRFAPLGCKEGRDGIESFILERGWSNGEVIIGKERIWIREGAWWEAESMLDMLPNKDNVRNSVPSIFPSQQHDGGSEFYSPFGDNAAISQENLLQRNQSSATFPRSAFGGQSLAPSNMQTVQSIAGGDYGLGTKGDEKGVDIFYNELDPELAEAKNLIKEPTSASRRFWVTLTWALTFWIPSFLLRYVGGMKRPDVRMAWREKLVLVTLIFVLNAFVVFYIIAFGRLLCPNFNKAWNNDQVSYHQGANDFYVSVHGSVYDISKFWKIDHSNIAGKPVSTLDMQPTAGQNCNQLFPIPWTVACPGLATQNLQFRVNVTDPSQYNPNLANAFVHNTGSLNVYPTSNLQNPRWFNQTFLPRMKKYYKGELVYSTSVVASGGQNNGRNWVILDNKIYDFSEYVYTMNQIPGSTLYEFLDKNLVTEVQTNPGADISKWFHNWEQNNFTAAEMNRVCMDNLFYLGHTDFRNTARCQVNNYILLGFTIILCTVILVKFLAALQLGGKRRPAQQDKFVICQVPAYTEGEDHLRKGLDSLTALAYDNKRKLICVICDGMIVGGGNDRPTPKIVLDILGVDPKIDPPALPFKSVGAGSEQLNYGKVYSGLYEYEGNVVPYIVVVKVGKESEQKKPKPGNRGKRDSQILLMSFLNRVHHRSAMSPLELEMFHQINNIIGVDPELYEYLFMVDADTMVKEDALNRLVASCADDAKIAGICGETSLENEERSWWTMIQVYEYYISHHLAKAFESLFGSVTCLPGCFCMYRLRTADKGKPLIIADKLIKEYSDCNVDTLHKKNLLALGEDRYLTTLMTKHFPHMSYKFVPSALALTAAPDTWGVLLSQRRRWINSTIHNLAELFWLKDLCGFCCFSMRFVVFIDLFGTIILPATCGYIGYLIYKVSTHAGSFPLISIIMIAAVYGLQMIIFIIKRQWQHIGWMIIYLCAFPVYAFFLPVYAFWKQDDFSWGSTRIVIGETGQTQVVAVEEEGFDPRSIPLQRWDDYATANNLPGRRGLPPGSEKNNGGAYEDGYEMDDMRSVYSSAKPASTILTGFKSQGPGLSYMAPQSPAAFSQHPGLPHRQSNFSHYTDNPVEASGRLMSLGATSEQAYYQNQQALAMRAAAGGGAMSAYTTPYASMGGMGGAGPRSPGFAPSTENLLQMQGSATPPPFGAQPLNRAGTRSPGPFVGAGGRQTPTMQMQQPVDFVTSAAGTGGPTDAQISEAVQACLAVVDLDSVNKKGLKQLVEQRLQHQLSAERRAYLDRAIDFELANL